MKCVRHYNPVQTSGWNTVDMNMYVRTLFYFGCTRSNWNKMLFIVASTFPGNCTLPNRFWKYIARILCIIAVVLFAKHFCYFLRNPDHDLDSGKGPNIISCILGLEKLAHIRLQHQFVQRYWGLPFNWWFNWNPALGHLKVLRRYI